MQPYKQSFAPVCNFVDNLFALSTPLMSSHLAACITEFQPGIATLKPLVASQQAATST